MTITTEAADLLITIKSDHSTIRVKDWIKTDNRIEYLRFAGDTQVDLNDILFPKTEGDDMVIGFKEDGKSFEELSTRITLKNNAVEHIELDDGHLLVY